MGEYDFPRSVSQRREYRACGYKWFLHRMQGLRMRHEPGRFAFGDVMQAVADHIVLGGGTVTPAAAQEYFDAVWLLLPLVSALRDAAGYPNEPTWPKTKGWGWYRERGRALAAKAATELPAHIRPNGVCVVNRPVRFTIEGVQEVAIPDLVTHVDRRGAGVWQDGAAVLTVLGWETAA